MPRRKNDRQSDVALRPDSKTKPPRRFKVILHNDDYTSMEFVIEILISIFDKSPPLAVHIMLSIHRTGSGVAGVYTKDIAESKVREVEDQALMYGYPLLCTMEPI